MICVSFVCVSVSVALSVLLPEIPGNQVYVDRIFLTRLAPYRIIGLGCLKSLKG